MRERTKYTQRVSGEVFELQSPHLLACCDCGLIHKIKWVHIKGRLFISAARDNRRTAARRRGKKWRKAGTVRG